MNSSSKRGDLFVKVVLTTPSGISDEEKKLYRRLYELEMNKMNKESLFDKMRDAISGGAK